MPITQNGWVSISSDQLDRSLVPGTSIRPEPGVKKGDVAVVLLEVARQFNEKVEKLYNPGCWGWAPPTSIPGSNVLSNHSSGTAIDLNAPSFPWKKYVMTAKQRTACRSIVNSLDGVVDWGGDFPTYVDEMHFEISPTATELEISKVAQRIKSGNKGEEMITRLGLEMIYRFRLGRTSDSSAISSYLGKMTFDEVDTDIQKSAEYKQVLEKAKAGNVDLKQFAGQGVRDNYKAPSDEYVPVTEKLFRKK